MIRRTCGAFLFALLIAACASVRLAPPAPEPFDLVGRVLASYSGGAVTANVRWEHSTARDEIWLMTPTGQTLAHIVDTQHGVVLTRADQQEHRAQSVEALTRQVLGWPLPLSQLQYWIRGVPAPGAAASDIERDASKRLVRFTQDNWQVALSWREEGEHVGQVRSIDLVDGPNRIRFVVDTWRSVTGS
jgi:outer membrane lipoprotein LolB